MGFTEIIREKQTAVLDKVWESVDKTTGLPEGNDHCLELLQWYLGLILEFI
jgi:hypothetical protein